MSKQIAVRLPDDLVDFIDSLVNGGDAASRAAVVSQAIRRERRRRGAERDAAIYAADRATPDADGLDGFIAYTSRTALDDLD